MLIIMVNKRIKNTGFSSLVEEFYRNTCSIISYFKHERSSLNK